MPGYEVVLHQGAEENEIFDTPVGVNGVKKFWQPTLSKAKKKKKILEEEEEGVVEIRKQ